MSGLLELPAHRPALVVPDLHQDLDFLDRVVAFARREDAALVFLGDYVDGINPRWKDPSALGALADRLPELALTHAAGCFFLAGNHDVQAIQAGRMRAGLLIEGREDEVARLDAAIPAAPAYGRLLGAWSKDFLRTWRVAALIHGHLATHAGVARRYWPWGAAADAAGQARAFLDETQAAWERFVQHNADGPLFEAGPGRGGRLAPVGGPLWLDWDTEFVDDLPLPQVVGHTRGREARRKDRSWCLDAGQTCAALIDPDLGLRVLPL